jgi:hypothetical protein
MRTDCQALFQNIWAFGVPERPNVLEQCLAVCSHSYLAPNSVRGAEFATCQQKSEGGALVRIASPPWLASARGWRPVCGENEPRHRQPVKVQIGVEVLSIELVSDLGVCCCHGRPSVPPSVFFVVWHVANSAFRALFGAE